MVFGSPCTEHRNARNESLGKRGKDGLLIEEIDEIKSYRIYILKERLLILARHVRNVDALTTTQKKQLEHSLLEVEDTPTKLITPVNETVTKMRGNARGRKSFLDADAYGSRSTPQKEKNVFQVK